MKKILVVFFMLFNFCFAQETTMFLLKSEKSDILEMCRTHKIPVYHLWDEQAIVELTEKQQKLLSQSVKIISICNSQQSQNFSILLSDKQTSLDYYRVSGDLFYSDSKLQIVNKPLNQVRNDLKNVSAKILPLKDQPVTLPEVTHYQQNKVENNAEIANVLTYINQDSVRSYIQHLQDYQTRYSQHPNRREIAFWIRDKFLSFGLTNVQIDSFYSQNTYYVPDSWQYNVVATKTGSMLSTDVFVLGAHYDSMTNNDPTTWCPGVEDNASGSASVLECARVISKSGFNTQKTIKFIAFAQEEAGWCGSGHYADQAVENQEKIKLMFNNDMISYSIDNISNWKAAILPHPGLLAYEQLAKQLFNSYTTLNTNIYIPNGCSGYMGSDNLSFYEKGIPSQSFKEHEFSSNYHRDTDIIDNSNIPYCTQIIKGTCAVLLQHSSFLPSRVDSLTLYTFTGNDIFARWSKSKESNISGYKIYLGTATGNYTQTINATDTTITINNLNSGTTYYIGITACNTLGNEAVILEKSIRLQNCPDVPEQFAAESGWQKIKLNWNKNHEADLAGYNLYQSLNNIEFTKINTALILDTLLEINNSAHNYYTYFKISAVDLGNNESNLSLSVTARPVTLDQGILLVDESTNGTGTQTSPDDAQQDNFFSSLLVNCPQVSNYDAQSSGKISLSELGPYSTVIWHNQSVELGSVFNQNQAVIKKYLDFGGKILITADKPGKLIESCNSYPADFNAASLAEQYFGLDSVNYKSASRFSGANPIVSGYNYLTVDSGKALSENGFHLKKIETLRAKSNAEVIYKYDSKYESSTNYGYSKNQPVGITYSGSNFKTATLAIPLYFIKQDEARKVVEYILKNKFGETVDIKENTTLASKTLFLEQNYPNPFNNSTIISFNLPQNGSASLAIYNAKGELVKELLNNELSAGNHSMRFNADNLNSGVYFYRLSFGGEVMEKKLVLVK